MDTRHYALVGWLAIAKVLVSIPILVISITVEIAKAINPAFGLFVILFALIDMLLNIYILFAFRQMLNREFGFHMIDDLVPYLIIMFVIFGITNISGWMFFEVRDIIKIVLALLFCPLGILLTLFGIRMLQLQDSLFGLLKPYAYLTIVSGICCITILLAFFGMLISMVSAIIQGLIFIRCSEQAEFI
jgi:hypothetical protein